ncbi:MAG TPA: chemotaxis protein CheD [Bacillota bacterium]|nr:chemotaxis protein CheD [Bacillota bacterium]
MENLLSIGLGEMQISDDPNTVMVCYGLGSCIGISFYDPIKKVGALAHIVLPDSALARDKDSRPKYANTCIPYTLEKMQQKGALISRIIVKIAGGAQVLQVAGIKNRLDIGSRNIDAVKEALKLAGLPLRGQDVGGNFGRTMQFSIADGKNIIKMVGKGEKEI